MSAQGSALITDALSEYVLVVLYKCKSLSRLPETRDCRAPIQNAASLISAGILQRINKHIILWLLFYVLLILYFNDLH